MLHELGLLALKAGDEPRCAKVEIQDLYGSSKLPEFLEVHTLPFPLSAPFLSSIGGPDRARMLRSQKTNVRPRLDKRWLIGADGWMQRLALVCRCARASGTSAIRTPTCPPPSPLPPLASAPPASAPPSSSSSFSSRGASAHPPDPPTRPTHSILTAVTVHCANNVQCYGFQ